MFFPDLSPYAYFPDEPADTLNVGWLDPAHPFETGETDPAFRETLRRLCSVPVRQTRGLFRCPFCLRSQAPSGSAEIRVPGRGKTYAAPTLVHHYVAAHGYRPPQEFVDAVLAAPEP